MKSLRNNQSKSTDVSHEIHQAHETQEKVILSKKSKQKLLENLNQSLLEKINSANSPEGIETKISSQVKTNLLVRDKTGKVIGRFTPNETVTIEATEPEIKHIDIEKSNILPFSYVKIKYGEQKDAYVAVQHLDFFDIAKAKAEQQKLAEILQKQEEIETKKVLEQLYNAEAKTDFLIRTLKRLDDDMQEEFNVLQLNLGLLKKHENNPTYYKQVLDTYQSEFDKNTNDLVKEKQELLNKHGVYMETLQSSIPEIMQGKPEVQAKLAHVNSILADYQSIVPAFEMKGTGRSNTTTKNQD